ncbi:MAG TPA: chemotaxis protein CheB [Rubricoccaceae bacterium]
MHHGLPIVVVGASAGGVEALQALVADLPEGFPAAVFVVLHVPAWAPSHLAEILDAAGPLPAAFAEDGERVRPGRIYVARPDHHLLLDGDLVAVRRGPKENRYRPSVDALFRSAAYAHGPRVVGVVLSGALDDGTSGLWTVKRLGGTAVVQSPTEAGFGSMPQSAMDHVDVDHACPAAEIGPLLARLVAEPAPDVQTEPGVEIDRARAELEVSIASTGNAFQQGIMEYGSLTPFTCPECHGALVRIEEGALSRFRCHTGHAYTPNALLADITESVEETLWAAMRAIEEGVMLLRETGGRYAAAGDAAAASTYAAKADALEERARVVHESVLASDQFSGDKLREQGDG